MYQSPDRITLDTKIRICKLSTHSLLFEKLRYELCNTMLELPDTARKRTVNKTEKTDERNLSLHQTREVFSVFKSCVSLSCAWVLLSYLLSWRGSMFCKPSDGVFWKLGMKTTVIHLSSQRKTGSATHSSDQLVASSPIQSFSLCFSLPPIC